MTSKPGETETKECPFCKEEIKAGAIKCKHCSSVIPEVKSHDGTCPYCKEAIQPTAIKCKHCKSTLTGSGCGCGSRHDPTLFAPHTMAGTVSRPPHGLPGGTMLGPPRSPRPTAPVGGAGSFGLVHCYWNYYVELCPSSVPGQGPLCFYRQRCCVSTDNTFVQCDPPQRL